MDGRRSVDTSGTGRLVAERLRIRHLGQIWEMHRDPWVVTTLGGLRADEETAHYLRGDLDHRERYGYGIWVFRDRAEGRFVGRAGLRNTCVGGHDGVELPYALVAEYWDRGPATEMSRAILKLALDRLGLADVVCFALPTNRASQRVMEKAGFGYERDVVYAGLPHVLCRITATGWENRHRS